MSKQNSHSATCDCCHMSYRCASLRRGRLCLPCTFSSLGGWSSPSLSLYIVCQSLNRPGSPCLHWLWYVRAQLVLWNPELGTGLQVLYHKCQTEGRDHFPQHAGCSFASTDQDAAVLLHSKGKLLTLKLLNPEYQVNICQYTLYLIYLANM